MRKLYRSNFYPSFKDSYEFLKLDKTGNARPINSFLFVGANGKSPISPTDLAFSLNGAKNAGRNFEFYDSKSAKSKRNIGQTAPLALASRIMGRRIVTHSFRASQIRHLFNAGVDSLEVSKLVGHESVASTQVYTKNNITLAELRAALNKKDEHLSWDIESFEDTQVLKAYREFLLKDINFNVTRAQ